MALSEPAYIVVVATAGRPEALHNTIRDWQEQKAKPKKIVVVDFGGGESRFSGPVPVENIHSPVASAARQRNLGAERVKTDWIVFCDDDVRLGPILSQQILEFLDRHPEAVAVFPRMRGSGHPAPGPWLRRYYDWQAGERHPYHGARLFGPGISTYPCWEKQLGPVESNWLPSTLLWIRRNEFEKVKFPDFQGYSFGEDAYLTHRIWRNVQPGGKMYFLDQPEFDHISIQSGIKRNRFALARMATRNQRRIAREAMGMGAFETEIRLLAHRVFVSLCLLRQRKSGWFTEIAGLWCA